MRRTADRVVLLADAREPLTLHGTGAALWDIFESPRTAAEAAAILAEMFASDARAIEADIGPVIDELERAGALRVTP